VTPTPFSRQVSPNWEAFRDCIAGAGTPSRVHNIELFLDPEVQRAVAKEFGLLEGLDSDDPFFLARAHIRIQRFLGYDYVVAGVDPIAADFGFARMTVDDTAELARDSGRHYIDEHRGPISNWAEFNAYRWPAHSDITTNTLAWYESNLPDDMCVIGGLTSHFSEWLTWLMGYETLCYALFDDRDLVRAICDRILELTRHITEQILQFDCVKFIWGSDDLGYRTSTLISPDDTREFILPGHREMAQLAHDHGCLYLLHSCGNLREIIPDLIDDVRIDAKHSFEDTIEQVTDVKYTYGQRIALLGGIDVDFLCRATPEQIRERVRNTLDVCLPGGRYCLGTGNSVANYIPLGNYLAMLDEGRRYTC